MASITFGEKEQALRQLGRVKGKDWNYDAIKRLVKNDSLDLDSLIEDGLIKFDEETAARLVKDFVGSKSSDIREIAKIIVSDNLMKQLQPETYAEVLKAVIDTKQWKALEVLLLKTPSEVVVKNHFLKKIPGDILLEQVLKRASSIDSTTLNKIMQDQDFLISAKNAVNELSNEDFTALCKHADTSMLDHYHRVYQSKMNEALFSFGDYEKDDNYKGALKSVVAKISGKSYVLQLFMAQNPIVKKVLSHSLQKIAAGIKGEKVLDSLEDALKIFSKLSGAVVQEVFYSSANTNVSNVANEVLKTIFDSKYFGEKKLSKGLDSFFKNLDDKFLTISQKNFQKEFALGCKEYFVNKNLSGKDLLVFAETNYIKSGHPEVLKFLLEGGFDLGGASEVGEKIKWILSTTLPNQEKIIKILAASQYIKELAGDENYKNEIFHTLEVLISSGKSGHSLVMNVKKYLGAILNDKAKEILESLADDAYDADEDNAGVAPIARSDIDPEMYRFKTIGELLDQRQQNIMSKSGCSQDAMDNYERKMSAFESDQKLLKSKLLSANIDLEICKTMKTNDVGAHQFGVGNQINGITSDVACAGLVSSLALGIAGALFLSSIRLQLVAADSGMTTIGDAKGRISAMAISQQMHAIYATAGSMVVAAGTMGLYFTKSNHEVPVSVNSASKEDKDGGSISKFTNENDALNQDQIVDNQDL